MGKENLDKGFLLLTAFRTLVPMKKCILQIYLTGGNKHFSRTGQCLDNAVAESFFGTLKAELLGDQPGRFQTKRKTFELVADYIDNFYNLVRRHSALGLKVPLTSNWLIRPNSSIPLSLSPLDRGTFSHLTHYSQIFRNSFLQAVRQKYVFPFSIVYRCYCQPYNLSNATIRKSHRIRTEK
jgi:hypothetical protein